jgi:enterochelin esterase-like enzyme
VYQTNEEMKHYCWSLMFLLWCAVLKLPACPLYVDEGGGESLQRVERIGLMVPCRQLEGFSEWPVTIFLPASYRQQEERRYPVLYLMHGITETPQVWQQKGRLCEVIDSMTRCGDLSDMIIVCPAGDDDHMHYYNAPDWHYEDFFFQELIPFVEHNYRVRTDKGSRAISGFSLGGGCALAYGVRHPDLFSMAFAISGFMRSQPVKFLVGDPRVGKLHQIVDSYNPIARISDGTADEVALWRDVQWCLAIGDHDFTLETNLDMIRALRSKRLPYQFYVSPGRHNWDFVFPAMLQMLRSVSQCFEENEKK